MSDRLHGLDFPGLIEAGKLEKIWTGDNCQDNLYRAVVDIPAELDGEEYLIEAGWWVGDFGDGAEIIDGLDDPWMASNPDLLFAARQAMQPDVEARIIGETSAGMTGLEIWKAGVLFWSYNWFEMGATSSGYAAGLREVFDAAVACNTVEDWAEWQYDANNRKIVERLDNYPTTWVVASYTPDGGWILNDPGNDGQANDFVQSNADRLPAEQVARWNERL